MTVEGVYAIDTFGPEYGIFALYGYVTEPCTNVEDLLSGPALPFGTAEWSNALIGLGTCPDLGAV